MTPDAGRSPGGEPEARLLRPAGARRPRRLAHGLAADADGLSARDHGRAPGPARGVPVLGRRVQKKIRALSGGEKSRLVIASMLYDPPNFLVLDEPTNHLDLATKEMLVEALRDFDGTMLFVSHDRTFLRGLSNRVLELGGETGNDAEPHLYPGPTSSTSSGRVTKRRACTREVGNPVSGCWGSAAGAAVRGAGCRCPCRFDQPSAALGLPARVSMNLPMSRLARLAREAPMMSSRDAHDARQSKASQRSDRPRPRSARDGAAAAPKVAAERNEDHPRRTAARAAASLRAGPSRRSR